MSFLSPFKTISPGPFEATWISPSNIALVKYWGKKGHQLPANPSLSMTLQHCATWTRVIFTPESELSVDLYLDGVREEKFSLKLKNYLHSLMTSPYDLKWIGGLSLKVETKNTFPHGTGIASSASGLSAFCLCLTDYLFKHSHQEKNFFEVASYLSRLASGSACRSIYGGFTSWGKYSDEFASPEKVHPDFNQLKDSVIIVDEQEKKVSSSEGHSKMSHHPFKEVRFEVGRKHFELMESALRSYDLELMGEVLEKEALSLHAMMMTAPSPYILLRPSSLSVIELVRSFRKETRLPLYFTLDAGPNVHLIYPEAFSEKIQTFIRNELSPLAVRIIHDERGEGPKRC